MLSTVLGFLGGLARRHRAIRYKPATRFEWSSLVPHGVYPAFLREA